MTIYSRRAAENMQDAFAQLLFDPFDNGVEGMLESFGNALRQMAAQQLAANAFNSVGGANALGNILGGLFGSAATFGTVDIGATGPTGPIVYNPTGNAKGGYQSGPGTGTSDQILTRVSNGEYVIRAASVSRFGKGFFDSLNSGSVPRFANGGMAGSVAGGAGTVVQVFNSTGAPVREERSTAPDGRELIRVLFGEMQRDAAENGPYVQTLSRQFGLQRRPNVRS